MSLTRKDYQRVPGQTRSGGMAAKTILLNADDHLLLTTIEMGAEHYRRFYLKDIEAIVVQRTRGRAWGNVGFCVLIALFIWGLAAAQASASPQDAGVILACFGGVLGIIGLLMLAHNLQGTHCRTILQTRVQSVTLTSLSRLRKTKKAATFLSDLVSAAQPGAAAASYPQPEAPVINESGRYSTLNPTEMPEPQESL